MKSLSSFLNEGSGMTLTELKKRLKVLYPKSKPEILGRKGVLIRMDKGTIILNDRLSNKLGFAVKAEIYSDGSERVYLVSIDKTEGAMEKHRQSAENDRNLRNSFSYLF